MRKGRKREDEGVREWRRNEKKEEGGKDAGREARIAGKVREREEGI